ncbi:hypothetical protein ACHQM5_030905 [Ranunculus cassubicifolius]
MVRLVFRPYTQVRRTICTSVSLRASTRVSSGFAPLRHSSPSFGSRQLGTVTRLPVHPASPVLLTKNGPLGALDSVARLNEVAAPSYLFKV